MPAKITTEILESYLTYQYKGNLQLAGDRGITSDYDLLLREARVRVRRDAAAKLVHDKNGDFLQGVVATFEVLTRGVSLLLDVTLEDEQLKIHFDGLQRPTGPSRLGDFHYIPILVHEGEQPGKDSFYPSDRQTPHSKYGWGFRSYVIYQLIELRIPGTTVSRSLNQLFDLNIPNSAVPMQKRLASSYYEGTYNEILTQLVSGSLIHADETRVTIDHATSYVWVFANHHSVAYKCTDTREGEMVQELLLEFKAS
jgi:Transposase IS66 family